MFTGRVVNEFYLKWAGLFDQSLLTIKAMRGIAPKWKNLFDKSKN